MTFRITLTEGLNIIKKTPSGIKYFNKLLEHYTVEFKSKDLKPTEISLFLTEKEKINVEKNNRKWTLNLFLRCLERFIKNKSPKYIKVEKFRSSQSVFNVKFTGMIN
jgi:hypothetical protein